MKYIKGTVCTSLSFNPWYTLFQIIHRTFQRDKTKLKMIPSPKPVLNLNKAADVRSLLKYISNRNDRAVRSCY